MGMREVQHMTSRTASTLGAAGRLFFCSERTGRVGGVRVSGFLPRVFDNLKEAVDEAARKLEAAGPAHARGGMACIYRASFRL